jgi:hypothetical protein
VPPPEGPASVMLADATITVKLRTTKTIKTSLRLTKKRFLKDILNTFPAEPLRVQNDARNSNSRGYNKPLTKWLEYALF